MADNPPVGIVLAPSLIHWPGYLDAAAQARLRAELAVVLADAPAYTPRMPRTDKPFSVRMSNCGPLGWVSDRAGYRYQLHHPETGAPWPAIPATALAAWTALADYPDPPEACLVNLYGPDARMGLHQDRDEDALDAPVVSLSLGATALFRYGGLTRRDPTRSVRLRAGDALVMGGPARLIHHGIDRLIAEGADPPQGAATADARAFLPPGGRALQPDPAPRDAARTRLTGDEPRPTHRVSPIDRQAGHPTGTRPGPRGEPTRCVCVTSPVPPPS